MAEKLTEVQAKALCLMPTMIANGHYRADDLAKANGMITEMIIDGQIEKADGMRVAAWLGNASAVDQWGVKQGYVKRPGSDKDALAMELDRLIAASKAEAAKGKAGK